MSKNHIAALKRKLEANRRELAISLVRTQVAPLAAKSSKTVAPSRLRKLNAAPSFRSSCITAARSLADKSAGSKAARQKRLLQYWAEGDPRLNIGKSVSDCRTPAAKSKSKQRPVIHIDPDAETFQEVTSEPPINMVKETIPFASRCASRNVYNLSGRLGGRENHYSLVEGPLMSTYSSITRTSDLQRLSSTTNGSSPPRSSWKPQTPKGTTYSSTLLTGMFERSKNTAMDWLPEYSPCTADSRTHEDLKEHMNKIFDKYQGMKDKKCARKSLPLPGISRAASKVAHPTMNSCWKKDMLGFINPLGRLVIKLSGTYVEDLNRMAAQYKCVRQAYEKKIQTIVQAYTKTRDLLLQISKDEYEKVMQCESSRCDDACRVLRIKELSELVQDPPDSFSNNVFNTPSYIL